jgi:hypothetical protein
VDGTSPYLHRWPQTSGTCSDGSFLLLTGYELQGPVDERERVVLGLAAGQLALDVFLEFTKTFAFPIKSSATFSHRTEPHWPVGLTRLMQFLYMATKGRAERGAHHCVLVGLDVLMDLLDCVGQLPDHPSA